MADDGDSSTSSSTFTLNTDDDPSPELTLRQKGGIGIAFLLAVVLLTDILVTGGAVTEAVLRTIRALFT